MERSRVILDSNVFIAFYFAQDSLHEKAVELLEGLSEAEIIVPYCVIQEVSTILCYRLGKKAADAFLVDLKNGKNVLLVNDDVHSEIAFFQNFPEKVSFTDISLIFISLQFQAELYSFDDQLNSIYKKTLI